MPVFPSFARKPSFLALTIITAVGLLLYLHTLHVPWYLDDRNAIVNSGALRDLSAASKGILGQRGLALWTFALNIAVGGLALPGFHLVNIAIHLACGWIVYLLLLPIFSRQRWLPLIGALLFVAHPLQTGAVTYIVQRMTSLSALLTLLALYLGARAWEVRASGALFAAPRHLAWYATALLCGGLALLSKETAIMLPLLLLLYARFFLPRFAAGWRGELLFVAPFAVVPLLYAGAMLAPVLTGASQLAELGGAQSLGNMEGNDPLHYLVTQFSVIWIYLRLLVLPVGQALDYGYPISQKLVTLQSSAGFLGILGLLGLAWRLRLAWPAISCGIFWFFVALLPESSLIPLDALFEHRLYLPMFGFILVFCACLEMVPRTVWMLTLAVLLLIGCGLLTWQRNALWNDQVAFFEDNLKQRPENERVAVGLAGLYLLHRTRLAEVEPLLQRAMQMNPANIKAVDMLSRLYLETGRKAAGLQVLEASRQQNPRSGWIHIYLSEYKELLGDESGAEAEVRRAVALEPNLFDANLEIGRFLARRNGQIEAESYLRKAIALKPGSAVAHADLAVLLQMQGRFAEAAQESALAAQLDAPPSPRGAHPHSRP